MIVVTLGPSGSCHENALKHYLDYHESHDATVVLVSDILQGLEQVRGGEADYLVQCSAHLDVHTVTERYPNEVFVLDTFIFPTREMAVLERNGVAEPQTLGLPKPTEGYLGDLHYPNKVYEITKPVVAAKLLAGAYDAGLTNMRLYREYPEQFHVRKYIGRVITTWLVYGRHHSFKGKPLGTLPRGFFESVDVSSQSR